MQRRVAKAYVDEESFLQTGVTSANVPVVEQDTFTGLYDVRGVPLHREKEPFGFRVREQ